MVPFLRQMRRVVRLGRALGASESLNWARLLEKYGIDVRRWPCEPRKGGLFFSDLGTTVPGPAENVLLSGFLRATRLHAGGVDFEAASDSTRAKIGSVCMRVDTTEELLIIEEIYLDGIYHFGPIRPLLIIDIGMNEVTQRSILRQSIPRRLSMPTNHSRPPFRSAEMNINLNPSLKSRIRHRSFGLSDSNRSVDLEYAASWRGSVGIYGIPAALRRSDEIALERCELRDASTEFAELYAEFPNRRIVVKIDCEGAEYSILSRLADAAMLSRIDLLMIECHRRASEHDPAALRALLGAHDFGSIHMKPDAPDISMLYAFRL